MIYNFPIPIILDKVDFIKLVRKLYTPDMAEDLVRCNEHRKTFNNILTEAYMKHKSFGEQFSEHKDAVDAYLSINVDLVKIL
jgi:hypothetical protein